MKLTSNRIERMPNDKTRVVAGWRDRMRRPANVEMKLTVGSLAREGEVVLVEGDSLEVTEVFFALADMAWEMGWRPRGLVGSLANYVQGFKLPPAA